jgi:probable O-glycosylation ligase (exosortase A-associated)
VMFAASALLLQTVRHLWILMIVTALALGYIAYEVNFLYLVNGHLGIYHNGYGGLDNNGAGLMLAMGVPLCMFAWEGMRSRYRWVFLALVPVLLHAVLMTYSRGAMVSLLAVVPLIGLRSQHRRRIAVVGVLLLALIPFLAGQEIRDRFFSISEHDQDQSAHSRLSSWSAAWGIAKDNPIFGVGVRNANLFSYQYGADMEGRTIHNQYLQIAADTGLVGLSLYLTALLGVWWSLRKVRRASQSRHNPETQRTFALAAGLESALAVFCVGGVFLSLEVFELPFLLLLLGAQLGGLVSLPTAATARQPSFMRNLRPASATVRCLGNA